MTTYNVRSFWPFWTNANLLRFDYSYTDSDARLCTSIFSYDTGSKSMLYNNYDGSGNWLNKWWYNYVPGFGMAEYRDDYPNSKKVVLSPAIGWGDNFNIGDIYFNQPKFDFLKCWPPATGSGVQLVKFEEMRPSMVVKGQTYPNVLVLSYLQAWGGKAGTGARYYLAENVGPIAVEFITQNAPGSTQVTTAPRMDAVVTHV